MSSEPPLRQEDIVSLLATGSTAANLNSGTGLAGRAAILLLREFYHKFFKSKPPPENESFASRFKVNVGGVDARTGQQETVPASSSPTNSISSAISISAATCAEWFVISCASNDPRPTPISGGRANRPPKAHHRRGSSAGRLRAVTVMAQEPAPESNPARIADKPAPAAATPAPALNGKTGIRFIGASRFNNKQLRNAIADQITEMDQGGVNPASADDAAFFLGIFYRKNGYANVSVDSKVLGTHSLDLLIREGELTKLGNIEFAAFPACPLPP